MGSIFRRMDRITEVERDSKDVDAQVVAATTDFVNKACTSRRHRLRDAKIVINAHLK